MAVPIGLRGVFLAALFGEIQSTVSAVLNSTSTVFTMDIYKRRLRPGASEKTLVSVSRWSSVGFIVLAVALAYVISTLKESLFYYIQMFYSFFGPPFSAVSLLGSLWQRINAKGALTAVIVGFAVAIGLKVYVGVADQPSNYLTTFPIQALLTWAICMVVCVVVSLATAPPRPEQITDDLTFSWRKMMIKGKLGAHWYANVFFRWLLSAIIMLVFIYIFGVIL